MKNLSIRSRILAGVVLVNLIGAVVVMVYLHQSYVDQIDATVAENVQGGAAAWEQIKGPGEAIDPLAQPEEVQRVLSGMSDVTGATYGFLVDKAVTEAGEFESARETLGEAPNWDERDTYALLYATDEALAEDMQFSLGADSVPEAGKTIGVENGACSEMCHSNLTGEGDYWGVRWSDDSKSRSHGVFPVYGSSNEPVGVIYSIEDISVQADAARSTMVRTLVVIGLTLFVATLLIGWMIDALVFRRLARTVASIQDLSIRVAGGDFDAHFEPDGTSDEIGSFEQFFAALMDLMSSTLKSLVGKDKHTQ